MAIVETYDKFTIDRLTKDSVSIIKQTFIDLNGIETQVGENWRRSFVNIDTDRAEMSDLLGIDSIEYSVITQLWDS